MTGSNSIQAHTGTERAGKRSKLVTAAVDQIYRQGVARTTLADIAEAAGVPLGNVYYYFKTKDALIEAVVRAHVDQLRSELATLAHRHRTPHTRLKGLVESLGNRQDAIAVYGCLYGSLSLELAKGTQGSDPWAAALLEETLTWVETQFREMGRRDASHLAVEFVAAYQGAAVLCSALGKPKVMGSLMRRLLRWVEEQAV